jgi:hypothetical protein
VFLDIDPVFSLQFKWLMDLIDGKGSKGLAENAKTNVFPRRSLLPRNVNLAIIYATGIIYCLARFILIGLAFSSLRAMPDSVYQTTWASNIPAFQ